jgi:hypothetical protein
VVTKKPLILKNHINSLQSLRVVLNWIFCFLYIWVVIYAVIHYESSVNTAIVSTAATVNIIFTNYVISKHIKNNKNNGGNGD